MSEKKRYAAVKRVELAGLSEGWDETCFAFVIPSTYKDQKELAAADLASKSPEEQLRYQLDFVRAHFISGRIKVFDGKEFEEVDMTAEDTEASVDVTDYLYSEIMGLGLDPKDIRKVAASGALQSTEPTPTASPSPGETATTSNPATS